MCLVSWSFIVAPEACHIRQLSAKHLLLECGEDPHDVARDVHTGPAGVQIPETRREGTSVDTQIFYK